MTDRALTDIRCPRCGLVLQWACPGDIGEAYCEAWQSRRFPDGRRGGEPCRFRCRVLRVSPEQVALDTTDPAYYLSEPKR